MTVDQGLILGLSFLYLALLFAIAWLADRRADAGNSLAGNPYVYTLSIAVYCTAWTFYGSVGRAAATGIGFLPIYLGPTLMAALWWLVLRKIIRICKTYRITSIADFIASRYGKSVGLGAASTVIAVVASTPYIALQLKAVSASFSVLQGGEAMVGSGLFLSDKAFYVAMVLAAFAILFGTRHLDATERHEGMVVAIAFESVVKLVAFLAVGAFVTWGLFNGVGDLLQRASSQPELVPLFGLGALPGGYGHWIALTVLSMAAVLFLPRQFQITVVENTDERHLLTAAWLFPLYLFVINLFVLPIALGGLLTLGHGVDPDTFVLTLPLSQGQELLALLVYLGGFSAATSMVIVATVALSTMISNDLVMPALLRSGLLPSRGDADLRRLVLRVRRLAIVAVVLLGYVYYALVGESYALVSIGLIAFAAVAQFAPPILLGLYWHGAQRRGALAGLVGGFLVWGYTLLLPALIRAGWLPMAWLAEGPGGIGWLRPEALFGLEGLDAIAHGTLWSLLLNTGLTIGLSVFGPTRDIDRIQATLFVDVFRQSGHEGRFWQGRTTVADLHALLARFLGARRTHEAFADYGRRHGGLPADDALADPALVSHAERLLAGHIGATSARVMMGSVVKGEALTFEGVLEILDATSQAIEYSRRLEQKSQELERATAQLRAANERLQELDRLKDEFVSMVSHELRTPLTSIRAFGEILLESPDMPDEQRREFLQIVVRETERLSRLINEVLDLSRMESGWSGWRLETLDLAEVAREAADATSQLFHEAEVALRLDPPKGPAPVKGDRDRLMQLLINLLSNAAKFCPRGSGEVHLGLAADDQRITLRVQDNGPGIPPAEQARIFEKFHQLQDQRAGKPQGSGLGLSIARRIVELHWGDITVESTPGEGACFIVTLPRAGGEHCDIEPAAPPRLAAGTGS
ncbi:sensor histidine kinase [Sediminicurvatus halobius]|uniref:histidine kinase n=1 Tax=Sediminicurvatus halobius TaxID=2182432 RepID=A0A2U2N2U6_9GAMM|nr:sensor histidine kinase [Spiribacter halobius]PWG63561.1 histidine kinase [Spiribacter halobius]UEX79560.1 sensor histidine kinase [Spiribacter halobius]